MVTALGEYRKLIVWHVLRRIAFRVAMAAGLFALASWVAMVVEGAIALEVGGPTLSYVNAVAVVGALWVVIAPLIWLAFKLYVPPEPSPWPDRSRR